MKVLRFSHETRVYVFRGKELELPKPGTYDASRWTPPTHQVFKVEIQIDGLWLIQLNGAEIKSGDGVKPSRSAAESLVLQHCQKLLS